MALCTRSRIYGVGVEVCTRSRIEMWWFVQDPGSSVLLRCGGLYKIQDHVCALLRCGSLCKIQDHVCALLRCGSLYKIHRDADFLLFLARSILYFLLFHLSLSELSVSFCLHFLLAARTRRFSVIFAKVQWHPWIQDPVCALLRCGSVYKTQDPVCALLRCGSVYKTQDPVCALLRCGSLYKVQDPVCALLRCGCLYKIQDPVCALLRCGSLYKVQDPVCALLRCRSLYKIQDPVCAFSVHWNLLHISSCDLGIDIGGGG